MNHRHYLDVGEVEVEFRIRNGRFENICVMCALQGGVVGNASAGVVHQASEKRKQDRQCVRWSDGTG